jgi:hypothetical protein
MEPMLSKRLAGGQMPMDKAPADEQERERMRKQKKPMTDEEMDAEMKRRKKAGMG